MEKVGMGKKKGGIGIRTSVNKEKER